MPPLPCLKQASQSTLRFEMAASSIAGQRDSHGQDTGYRYCNARSRNATLVCREKRHDV